VWPSGRKTQKNKQKTVGNGGEINKHNGSTINYRRSNLMRLICKDNLIKCAGEKSGAKKTRRTRGERGNKRKREGERGTGENGGAFPQNDES